MSKVRLYLAKPGLTHIDDWCQVYLPHVKKPNINGPGTILVDKKPKAEGFEKTLLFRYDRTGPQMLIPNYQLSNLSPLALYWVFIKAGKAWSFAQTEKECLLTWICTYLAEDFKEQVAKGVFKRVDWSHWKTPIHDLPDEIKSAFKGQ